MNDESINVYDMFRLFTVDKSNVKDLMATELATQINRIYEDGSDIWVKDIKYFFKIFMSEKYQFDCLLIYTVDRINNKFIYKSFYDICSDENGYKMKKLGLSKFVISPQSNMDIPLL